MTNTKPLLFLIFIVFFWVITAISPVNRYDWMMENILFIIFFIILVTTYKKFHFSNIAYFLLTIFFTIHLTGAHYTYSEVPLGFWFSDIFGLSRNHFDRIGHFAFGLLMMYPIKEFLTRTVNLKGFSAFFIPLNVILSFSAFFEIIEWLFVLKLEPELREAYLGMQGDIWDAQKDMGLALIGAIIADGASYLVKRISWSRVWIGQL